MGFIERLRREIESQRLAQEHRARELLEAQEAKALAQQQREAQERAYHQQRQQQAAAFRQESGIIPLMTEFGRFLAEEGLSGQAFSPPFMSQGYISQVSVVLINKRGYPIGHCSHAGICESLSGIDPDSIFEVAEWDSKHTGYGRDKREHSEGWSEAEEKYLVVEATPNGDMVFHARNRKTIPAQKWRLDREILEKSIEEAFHRPGVNKFRYDHYKTESESG